MRDLPAQALLHADFEDPAIQRALAQVAAADAIVIATPVYKAAYSGILKAFLDLLPQDGLLGKLVLPIATGGSQSHMLALDYALRPVLASMDARFILPSIYATSNNWRHAEQGLSLDAAIAPRVARGIEQLSFELLARPCAVPAPRYSTRLRQFRTHHELSPQDRRNARRHAMGMMGAAVLAAGLPVPAPSRQRSTHRLPEIRHPDPAERPRHAGKTPGRQGSAVKWTEFPAGPVLLEGLNVGSIDFGTVGEAPPIFAQAAGAHLVYVGNEPPSPRAKRSWCRKGSSHCAAWPI